MHPVTLKHTNGSSDDAKHDAEAAHSATQTCEHNKRYIIVGSNRSTSPRTNVIVPLEGYAAYPAPSSAFRYVFIGLHQTQSRTLSMFSAAGNQHVCVRNVQGKRPENSTSSHSLPLDCTHTNQCTEM